ncbi:hypothetical protein [Mameliella alba]|uniref:hypothetical protein n=1 Tax=Mameliella alba TaxID=561184 RepID=UPI0020960708|nr:hypothetical protein [Mameliella alba]
MPNFFTATSGGVSGIVGGNGFSAIANVLTIAGTVYTIASEIGSHVNGNGSFSDVEDPSLAAIAALREELKAEIDGLRDDITELEAALTDLIVSQFSGVQQQLLASAQSRAKSALDLLASYAIDQDVDRGEIISDASRALRDALSQAEQLLRPGQDLETIKVAIGAVAYTLYARMEVARELEGGEIASDKITRQIEDVMTFFDNVVTYVISRLSVEYGFEDLRQTEGSPDYDPALQALYEQYTADYPPRPRCSWSFLTIASSSRSIPQVLKNSRAALRRGTTALPSPFPPTLSTTLQETSRGLTWSRARPISTTSPPSTGSSRSIRANFMTMPATRWPRITPRRGRQTKSGSPSAAPGSWNRRCNGSASTASNSPNWSPTILT